MASEIKTPELSAAQSQRIEDAQNRLMQFRSNDTSSVWIPVWSSATLERAVEAVLSSPDSEIGDVFRGLWNALGQSKAPLNDTMTSFLLDIVKICYGSRYRARYEAEDFGWMRIALQQGCSKAQAYLAAIALPPAIIVGCRDSIIKILTGTEFFENVRPMLDSDSL